MKHWYVVHTHANGELRAKDNLLRQGFDVWFPEYRKKRRHAGRQEIVMKPLFPRYIFVRVNIIDDPWRGIFSTYGVSNMVGDKDGPYKLDDKVVEGIKSRAGDDGIFELKSKKFVKGEKVIITAGPFSNLEAVFHIESDTERALVLLNLMGRDVRTSVSSQDLTAI